MQVLINETCVVTSEIEGFTYDHAKYVYESLREIETSEGRFFPIVEIDVGWTDDRELDCRYELEQPKFERIRRITGYLTGTLDSWNNAKRAEERERVKHEVS